MPIFSRSTLLSPAYIAVWIILSVGTFSVGTWGAWGAVTNYTQLRDSFSDTERTPVKNIPGIPDLSETNNAVMANARKRLGLELFRVTVCFIASAVCAIVSTRLIRMRKDAHGGEMK